MLPKGLCVSKLRDCSTECFQALWCVCKLNWSYPRSQVSQGGSVQNRRVMAGAAFSHGLQTKEAGKPLCHPGPGSLPFTVVLIQGAAGRVQEKLAVS